MSDKTHWLDALAREGESQAQAITLLVRLRATVDDVPLRFLTELQQFLHQQSGANGNCA